MAGTRRELLPSGIRSVVLLAGGSRGTSLASRVGRSVLDLPLTEAFRLLDAWRLRLAQFVADAGLGPEKLEVCTLAGSATAQPTVTSNDERLRFRAELDASRYRGTAGVLRDLCAEFDDDAYVLVGTASQCPGEGQIMGLLRATDPADDVTLSVGPDGSPTGLFLARSRVFHQVPAVGFVDLKEQALPAIARNGRVRVVETEGDVSSPIRTFQGYLAAVRSWHRGHELRSDARVNPFEERWRPLFSIVEPGAQVGRGTRLHDSVVLAGGVVEEGCDIVRSVVGPGGRVRRSQHLFEQFVAGKERAESDTPPISERGEG